MLDRHNLIYTSKVRQGPTRSKIFIVQFSNNVATNMLDRHNIIFFFSTKAQKTETVYYYLMGFPGGWVIKNLRAMQETHICSYE